MDSLLPPEKGSERSASAARRGRRGDNRLARTILLGSVAVAFSLYWLGRSFEVSWDEMRGYLLTSLLFVAVPASLAVLAGSLLWLVKRLGGGRGPGASKAPDAERSVREES